MATGRKTGGRNFEKGNHFAKMGGRPLIPDDLKEVKKITTEQAVRLITGMMSFTAEELVELIKDKKTPAMHGIIANIILKGLQQGDTTRMEFLFNRTIGRVLDKMEISMPKPFMIKRADGSVMLGATDDEQSDDQ